MIRATVFIAALIALSATSSKIAAASTPTDAPRVTVAQGRLEGQVRDGATRYLGVPYAAPPVGPLRWRPPQAPRRWDDVRLAASMGALCIQPPPGGDPGVGPMPMSEDCLTLNVWTPGGEAKDLPVMVWIHGGGFNNGSGTAALYDGAALARRGVVVVTVNYRLGRLGFFEHPALAQARPEGVAAGNYGLMDVIASLEWVRDNISAFGGDAGNVTVFGESAGGAAVTRLMISPDARGLFHRAIVQSGLGRERAITLAEAAERGRAYAATLGLPDTATADDLRAVPAERFLTPAPAFFGGDLPMIDGQVVTDQVFEAFAAGKQADVPLIIGTNSAEFWWIKPNDPSAYGAVDDALTADERAALVAAYGGQAAFDADIVSDMIFNEPARALARLHARRAPTFLYRFDVVADAMPEPHDGATHASERPYVFDNLSQSSWAVTDRDQRAAALMADYWTAFARSGSPNGQGRPDWPSASDSIRLLNFGNAGATDTPVPHGPRLDLIEAYFKRLAAEKSKKTD